MNSNLSVYCLIEGFYEPQDFIINKDKTFSDNDIIYLRETLTINIIENLISSVETEKLVLNIFLQEQKENYNERLTEYFSDKIKFNFFSNKEKFFEDLKQFSKYILIYSDTMGISPKDINTIENLISSDDNLLVISRSEDNDICYIAFNKFDNNLIELMFKPELNYDDLLSKIKTDKFFIHSFSGHFRVNNFLSFKLLYNKLSHKNSLNYCSHNLHEKFTNLFIEYRDYLK